MQAAQCRCEQLLTNPLTIAPSAEQIHAKTTATQGKPVPGPKPAQVYKIAAAASQCRQGLNTTTNAGTRLGVLLWPDPVVKQDTNVGTILVNLVLQGNNAATTQAKQQLLLDFANTSETCARRAKP